MTREKKIRTALITYIVVDAIAQISAIRKISKHRNVLLRQHAAMLGTLQYFHKMIEEGKIDLDKLDDFDRIALTDLLRELERE